MPGRIKTFTTFFINSSNPENLPILDLNVSIENYNRTQTVASLTDLQTKLRGYPGPGRVCFRRHASQAAPDSGSGSV
jgi:hypothetical protein